MKTQSGTIRYGQFMFLVAAFVHGSHMLLTFMSNEAKQDFYIVLISGFLLSLPFLWCYVLLSKWFPGKDLIQVLRIIYGSVLGRMVSLLYIAFFLLLLSFNLNDLSSFYAQYIIPDMPKIVFSAVFALVCGYAVKKGMDTVARFSVWSIIFGIITAVGTTLLLIGKLDMTNFLPAFQIPLDKYVQTASIFAAVPLGEIVVLLMVTPALKETKHLSKYVMGGAGIAVLIYLVIAFRNTASLGQAASLFTSVPYQSVRMVNIGGVLTRIELMIAIVITFALFVKISVLFFATAKGMAQLFPVKTHHPLILPAGVIAVVLALVNFESTVIHAEWVSKYAVFFAIPCSIVIPPATLLAARIRKLPRSGNAC